jgi:hypothetical protein
LAGRGWLPSGCLPSGWRPVNGDSYPVSLASVVAVALGLLLGVDVLRWDEVGVPVGGVLSDLPGVVVDESVVVAAE